MFGVLNLTERGLEAEEVNAVDVVQEIVEISVDVAAAKSDHSTGNNVEPFRGFMDYEDKGGEDGEAGGSQR